MTECTVLKHTSPTEQSMNCTIITDWKDCLDYQNPSSVYRAGS